MPEPINVVLDSEKVQKAVLVGVCLKDENPEKTKSLLDELEELVKNINIGIADKIIARIQEPNPHYLVGSGKFADIVSLAKKLEADCIVFDAPLSPAQQRNWEKDGNICVIDRQEVILDIFAERAQTKEARLQVELARLEYSLPRLKRAWTHLSRQRGGGVTQRGEGESQLELDQRIIRQRIARLKEDLIGVKSLRQTQRKRRTKSQVPTCAIVGYTNAGKSSLLNALAGSNVLAQDKLFATLDPTTRKVSLPRGSTVLLTDTVGFVRNLPHQFFDAFKATLEEAVLSDFLLHVVDSSNEEAFEHIDTTNSVLKELGADFKKILIVMNKIDIPAEETLHLRLRAKYPEACFVSVRARQNLENLLRLIEDYAQSGYQEMSLLIPHSKYKLIAALYDHASILLKKESDDGVLIKANIPKSLSAEYSQYSVS